MVARGDGNKDPKESISRGRSKRRDELTKRPRINKLKETSPKLKQKLDIPGNLLFGAGLIIFLMNNPSSS